MGCCSETHTERLFVPSRSPIIEEKVEQPVVQTPATSRKSCLECVEKHLGQAWVLYSEYHNGYPYKSLIIGHFGEAEAESEAWPSLTRCIRNSRKAFQAAGRVIDFDFLSLKVAEARSLIETSKESINPSINGLRLRRFISGYPLYVGCRNLNTEQLRKLVNILSELNHEVRVIGLGLMANQISRDNPFPDWVVCIPHGWVSEKTFYEMIHCVVISEDFDLVLPVPVFVITAITTDILKKFLSMLNSGSV